MEPRIDTGFYRSQRINDNIGILHEKPGFFVQHPCQQANWQQDDKKGYKQDGYCRPALAPVFLFHQVFHKVAPQHIKHHRRQKGGKKFHQAKKKEHSKQQDNGQEEVFIDFMVAVGDWHVIGFCVLVV